jgi:hypothetical protein
LILLSARTYDSIYSFFPADSLYFSFPADRALVSPQLIHLMALVSSSKIVSPPQALPEDLALGNCSSAIWTDDLHTVEMHLLKLGLRIYVKLLTLCNNSIFSNINGLFLEVFL